jgi:hypothetical protein
MSLPQTLRAMLATIIGEEFPGLALAGPWTYRVTKVIVTDGVRCNIEPVEGNRQQAHDNVDQWPGVGGAVVVPQVGAECLVEFRDGSKDRPVIVAFKPLRITGGKPTEIQINADAIELAGGGPAVARVGDTVTLSGITITAPTGSLGGPCVVTPGAIVLTGTITNGSPKVTSG